MSFYSGVSDFTSPTSYGAFWQTGSWDDPDQIVVCATNGYTFLPTFQSTLRATPSGVTYDGSIVNGSMVIIDGRLGTMTTKVAWLAAKNAGADDATLAQIQREAHGRGSVGLTQILKIAIQFVNASIQAREVSLSTVIHLPEGNGLIPPRWATASPAPPGWYDGVPAGLDPIHCSQPYLGDFAIDPADPTAPPETPPAPSPAIGPAPPPPSQGGPPIPPAPSPAEEDVPRPPGRSAMPVVQSGISWGPILIGAALIVTAVVVVNNLRSKPEPVRTPARRRKAA